MIKQCSRCKQTLECKADDIENCQCNKVILQEETRVFLAQTAYDCLCNQCLHHFDQLVTLAKAHHFPDKQELLVENIHYYKEDHCIVFTELYHFLKGYCCKNGCRHCVYGI
jgi:hypothetical protein